MAQSAFSVRMDSQLKDEFSSICDDFGIPVSTVIVLFAKAVVRERRIPFEIKSDTPNALTQKTLRLAKEGKDLHGPFFSVDELRNSLDA